MTARAGSSRGIAGFTLVCDEGCLFRHSGQVRESCACGCSGLTQFPGGRRRASFSPNSRASCRCAGVSNAFYAVSCAGVIKNGFQVVKDCDQRSVLLLWRCVWSEMAVAKLQVSAVSSVAEARDLIALSRIRHKDGALEPHGLRATLYKRGVTSLDPGTGYTVRAAWFPT